MKLESEEELREFILAKGCFDKAENLRIYRKFFRGIRHRAERLRYLLDFENKKVLDVGCSFGQNLIHFPSGCVGVELYPRMVKFANGLGLEVISANMEDYIPVESSSFDVIYCRDVLEHMVAPHKLLIEFDRILRPDGRLVLDVRNMDSIGSKSWNSLHHLYAYNKKSLIFLLERAGFKVKRYIILNQKLSKIINYVIYEKLLVKFMPALCVVAEKIPEISYDKVRLDLFIPSWLRRT